MKFANDDNAILPVVPPHLRCVWMTAGILSYQLCDRKFDCDTCPFDKAMRMYFGGKHSPDSHSQAHRRLSQHHDEPEYLYSRNHCWIQFLGENIVRIGIEPMLASLLISPKEIVLPPAGETLRYEHFSCWIILDDGAFPLTSPLSGSILRTNTSIVDDPHLICREPLNDGWFFEAEIHPGKMKPFHLMTKETADRIYETDFSRLNQLLCSAQGAKETDIGMTFQDGGKLLQNINSLPDPRTYFDILTKIFCPPGTCSKRR